MLYAHVCLLISLNLLVLVDCQRKRQILNIILPENVQMKQRIGFHPDAVLNFTQRSEKHGHPSEEYTVVTEDGYILRVFRLIKMPECVEMKSPPVMFAHGMFASAIAWLDQGPKSSLPYILSKQCYDIWLFNARGTAYSRRHVTYNPDKDYEFWQYSFHEIGVYDISATIDLILKETDSDDLNLITYSSSGGSFFALMSEKPEYAKKVRFNTLLAPAAYLYHIRSPILKTISQYREEVKAFFKELGLVSVTVHSPPQELVSFLCFSRRFAALCKSVITLFDGAHTDSVKSDTIRVMLSHFPDGVTVKYMDHFAQLMNVNKFRPYDYGLYENLEIYGRIKPASYNLTRATSPLLLMYSENDQFVDLKDIETLEKYLPNVIESYLVEDKNWNHFDFGWSKFVPKVILPKIQKYLELYSEVKGKDIQKL